MTKISPSVIVKCLGASALAAALTACSNNGSSIATGSTTITPAAAAGSYVFSAVGTDPTDGDYFVVGSFVADANGNITSATADYNLGSGIDANVALTGTYTIAGNVATVTLTNSTKSFTDTFNTNLGFTGTAPVTNFDGTGSGSLYHQVTSGFAPAGNYAYSVKGEGDGTVTGSGNFVAGAGGTITSGTSTYTDTATTTTASSVTGFVYAPQTNGRGQASVQGNNLAYYVISPSQVLLLGLDQRALVLFAATKS